MDAPTGFRQELDRQHRQQLDRQPGFFVSDLAMTAWASLPPMRRPG